MISNMMSPVSCRSYCKVVRESAAVVLRAFATWNRLGLPAIPGKLDRTKVGFHFCPNSKIRLEPLLHAFGHAADAHDLGARRQSAEELFAAFEQKSHGGRAARGPHHVGQPARVEGDADPHRQGGDPCTEPCGGLQ